MARRTRSASADFLTENGYPVAKSTLQKYATVGGGPRFMKFGNRVIYEEDDLLEWAESKLSSPISNTSVNDDLVAA